MLGKRFFSFLAAFVLALTFFGSAAEVSGAQKEKNVQGTQRQMRVNAPLNLAILVQDDLVPRVGNELAVTRDFVRSLPSGSRVMVAYISSGSLRVRQNFTTDLDKAARSLRIPVGFASAAPYNPYVQLRDAVRQFDAVSGNPNAVLLISDGLDVSRGFDITANAQSLDLERAIREANRRNVSVYSFYAPTVGLTSRNNTAVSYGQNSLNRLSEETGGEAFFQGSSFVTFDAYFTRLRRTLNQRYSPA